MGETREKMRACLQDEEAFCTAACPFRLDVRDFIEKMRRGSFNSAFRAYRNAVGFPGIVASLCPEPCKAVCPRRSTDAPISLRLLERAGMDHASNVDPTDYNVPRKDKRIAVVGAGVSGLAAALRLAARKYEVTVYERSDRIGGHLWGVLPPEVFLCDIERQFMHEKYDLRLDTHVESLDGLDFDAVYVATGAGGESKRAAPEVPSPARSPGCFWAVRCSALEPSRR